MGPFMPAARNIVRPPGPVPARWPESTENDEGHPWRGEAATNVRVQSVVAFRTSSFSRNESTGIRAPIPAQAAGTLVPRYLVADQATVAYRRRG
jgi:hypothetical protein